MPATFTPSGLPRPPLHPRLPPRLGHLPAWASRPLELLATGEAQADAHGGGLFALNLGVPAVVGFSPAWNKAVLTDLPTFVSAGSLSSLVPYLNGGVITTDAPQHKPRRGALNPSFGRRNLAAMRGALEEARQPFPSGPTDALAWADATVLHLLNVAYFSGEFDPELLHRFVAPLRRPFPAPMQPRPLVLAAVRRELLRLGRKRVQEPRADLLSHLARLEGGLVEARISLAAAHDTTTHALAYAVWHFALGSKAEGGQAEGRGQQQPSAEYRRALVKEVLRLYPPGWMGNRRLSRPTQWRGHTLPAGTLALYSSWLTHRRADLWANADEFWPQRWLEGHKPPAWGYLPFGGGERLCLGMHLANLLLEIALQNLPPLRALTGNPTPTPGLTLGPAGPLWVRRL